MASELLNYWLDDKTMAFFVGDLSTS